MTNKEAATIVKRIRYYMEGSECWTDAEFIAMDMAVKALEQPEIVTCKDCKDYQEGVDINGKPFSRCNGSVRTYGHTMPDWYCADAERREE